MRHRAPDKWTIQDELEIIGAGPNEGLSKIQDLVEQRGLEYIFLECLRLLNYKLSSIERNLPINKTILWIVPSAKFAAYAIHCCSQSRAFHDNRIPYFGDPRSSGVQYCKGDDQFIFRYCPLFRDMDTDLILVFPVEEHDQRSLDVAVRGSLERWGSECTLMVYSPLLYGDNLLSSVIISDTLGVQSSAVIDHVKSSDNPLWLRTPSYKKEMSLFYQMIWLAKLLVDVRQLNNMKSKSELLSDLHWESSLNSSFNSHILEQNLSYYKDGSLLKYIRLSGLWTEDDDEPYIGMYPVHKLVRLISSIPTPSLDQNLPSPAFNVASSNEFNHSDVVWFLQSFHKSSYKKPLIICGCINQLVPGLSTAQITKAASINCCNLSIECILYAKNK